MLKSKHKRGLVNALGSIVKAISGNLDQDDAERYDKAINTLSQNQIKVKTLIKDQITLFQKSIQTFQSSIKNLTENQMILKNRIDEIEKYLKNKAIENIGTYSFFFIEMVISQITTEFQIIYDILEKIEIGITFSKLNVFHNSIIDSNELLTEIKIISKHLATNNKLPFEPELENLLQFEKIIQIKSYSKGNQITFIIEIPIVENKRYNYYHLYPLPILKNNSFQIIIPRTKYLILNEQNHIFFNTKCQEVIPEEYICHERDPMKITEGSPCEIQLLRHFKSPSNCYIVPVNVTKPKVQRLEQNRWIVLSPEKAVAIQKCGNKIYENIPLQGTYVLELNILCELRLDDIIIQNNRNPKGIFKNIILPKIDFNHPAYKGVKTIKPVKLDSIELSEISAVKVALEQEKQKLDFIPTTSISFSRIDGWTILVYVLVFLFLTFVLYKSYRKYFGRKKETLEEIPLRIQTTHPMKNSEVNPRILH